MYIAALQKLQYIQIRFLLLCGNRSIIRSAFRSSAEVAVYSEMHIPALRKLQYDLSCFLVLCGNSSIIKSAFRSSAEVAVYSEMHIPAMGNRSIYNKTHISALLKSHYN